MDRMWSPWRSAYVSGAKQREYSGDTSLFTALLREECDAENLILWRGDEVFVIMNRHPYNSGHLLVVPYREVEQYDALTTGAGGSIDDHLHTHIVPRWEGDTNFMPTTAETKVLPEDLHTTYGKLRAVMSPAACASTRPPSPNAD